MRAEDLRGWLEANVKEEGLSPEETKAKMAFLLASDEGRETLLDIAALSLTLLVATAEDLELLQADCLAAREEMQTLCRDAGYTPASDIEAERARRRIWTEPGIPVEMRLRP